MTGPVRTEPAQDAGMTTKDIGQVLREQRDRIMAVPGVVGTGIGLSCDGQPCIKVYAHAPASALAARLPDEFDGYTVDIEVMGTVLAMPGMP